MASGDPSLADYYLEVLDFGHLGHSQFGLQQPSIDSAPNEFEPDDFSGSSPYSLSVQAETFLCRFFWDLYSVNR